jgi:hypothetical protein
VQQLVAHCTLAEQHGIDKGIDEIKANASQ